MPRPQQVAPAAGMAVHSVLPMPGGIRTSPPNRSGRAWASVASVPVISTKPVPPQPARESKLNSTDAAPPPA